MRRVCFFMILLCGVFAESGLFAQSSNASQTRNTITANEYIQSTSPLKNGGSVTSRVQPGRNVQTVTTIANLPVLGSGQASSAAAAGQSNSAQVRTAAASYPYPAATRPVATTAQLPVQGSQTAARQTAFQVPVQGSQTAARQTTVQVPTLGRNPVAQTTPNCICAPAQQTAFQVPTLGLTPVARTAQNCNCAPAPPRFFQPQQQSFAPAATQAPSLNAPNLNIPALGQTGQFAQPRFQSGGFQVPGFQSGTQNFTPNYSLQSGIGTPQFGNTGFGGGSNWLTTFFTGSGQYPNLLGFRNLPPGTQVGQGIIGQPTAYVDGQPFRNLFRWFLP